MVPITTHLIIRNNEETVGAALESVRPLGGRILVADLGCKDGTYLTCRRHGAEVVRLSFNQDYSAVRNDLVARSQTGWQFFLDPWERLASGADRIGAALAGPPAAYAVQCVQGTVLTKQVRVWHKDLGLKFANPVYENLFTNQSGDLPAVVTAANVDRAEENLAIIRAWMDRSPLAIDPYYYQACVLLSQRKWDDFLTVADYYLFHQKTAVMPVTMTRYYSAVVQCHTKKDHRSALRNVVACLATNPLMAEFWCLLGDIYYTQQDYGRAREFYENALALGARRLKSDAWPMDISKYKKYPTSMIEACDKVLKNSKAFLG